MNLRRFEPLQQAVNLAPQMPLYRTNLARAQLLGKDTKAAKANLDAVIKADPGQATAVALRAFLKLQEHDLPGAIALAQTLQRQAATRAYPRTAAALRRRDAQKPLALASRISRAKN